jgi:hypothetical protein
MRPLHTVYSTTPILTLWTAVFWAVTPWSLVGGYQLTRLHSITSKTNTIHIFIAMKSDQNFVFMSHVLNVYMSHPSHPPRFNAPNSMR